MTAGSQASVVDAICALPNAVGVALAIRMALYMVVRVYSGRGRSGAESSTSAEGIRNYKLSDKAEVAEKIDYKNGTRSYLPIGNTCPCLT